jgi:hypothetical protein
MPVAQTIYDETIRNGFAKLLTVNTSGPSTAILAFTSIPISTYGTFWFDLDKLTTSVNATPLVEIGTGGSWSTINYRYSGTVISSISPVSVTGNNSSPAIIALHGNFTGGANPMSGRVRMYFGPAQFAAILVQHSQTGSSAYCNTFNGCGYADNHPGADAVRFYPNSGVWTGGSIRMYGLKTGAM